MADVKRIQVKIGADTNELEKGLDKGQKQVDSFGKAIKKIGGLIAGAFAITQIARFTAEASKMAGQFEGIKAAFDDLNRPGLLDNLREATKGTVSDLNLMKAAVKADNFRIPLEQLGMFFKFAQERAKDTGESVDYLVESITNGIARKSILILDNLGLSAAEVQEEFAKTGDMAVAVGNIIQRDMGGASDNILTMAERQQQLTAQIDNTKVAFGQMVNLITVNILPALTKWLGALQEILQTQDQIRKAAWDNATMNAVTGDAEEVKFLTNKLMEFNSQLTEREAKEKAINMLLAQYVNLLTTINPADQDRVLLIKTQIAELHRMRDALYDVEKGAEAAGKKLDQAFDMQHERRMEAFGFEQKKDDSPLNLWSNLINEEEQIFEPGVDRLVDIYRKGAMEMQSISENLAFSVGHILASSFESLGEAIGNAMRGAKTDIAGLAMEIMSNIGWLLVSSGFSVIQGSKGDKKLLYLGLAMIAQGGQLQVLSGITKGLMKGPEQQGTAVETGGANHNVRFVLEGRDLVGAIERNRVYKSFG